MITSKRNFLSALLGTAVMLPAVKLPSPAGVGDHLKHCWSWYETREILNAAPVRRRGTEARDAANFTILSDSRRRDLLRLNPVAARVWELCDGRNDVAAMVQRITADYEVSPQVCFRDVLLTLTAFKRKGLISC